MYTKQTIITSNVNRPGHVVGNKRMYRYYPFPIVGNRVMHYKNYVVYYSENYTCTFPKVTVLSLHKNLNMHRIKVYTFNMYIIK
jgi:hypothetical protein